MVRSSMSSVWLVCMEASVLAGEVFAVHDSEVADITETEKQHGRHTDQHIGLVSVGTSGQRYGCPGDGEHETDHGE